jgi:secretion/DNA translocation related TadE-like protein
MNRPLAGDRGSATIWVLACCALVMAVAYAAILRTTAVLARHRAETAADVAALAAAGQIGHDHDLCAAASRVAAENHAAVLACTTAVDAGGRSGTVRVMVATTVHLPVVGARQVTATARAGRDPPVSRQRVHRARG